MSTLRIGTATALALAASAAGAQASTLTTLYAASAGAVSALNVSLVRGLTIYGTNAAGAGSVFRLTSGGAYATMYAFTGQADGAAPNARLVVDRRGVVFGTTRSGGDLALGHGAGGGTVFRLSASGQLTTLHTFTAGADGDQPRDGLAFGAHGELYGTTSMGDIAPGNGNVFSISTTGSFTVMHDFQSQADGHCPFTGVALEAGGSLVGTSVGYGFGGMPGGSVWQMIGGSVSTLYGFADAADGGWPQITPTVDAAGNIYGLTNDAYGKPSAGAIWSIGKTSGFVVLHRFSGAADGYQPNGPLLLAPDGNLYGTTLGGGDASGKAGHGTVFRITPAGVLTTLYTFTGGSDGAWPTGSLAVDASGNIYGGTQQGTIYELVP